MAPSKPAAARVPAQGDCLQDAVEALAGEVHTLAGQVEVLRVAVDDLRAEVEFAVRNPTRPTWVPTQPLTSGSIDPVAEDFPVNRTRRQDLPVDEAKPLSTTEPSTPAPASTEPPSPRKRRRKCEALF